MESGLKDNEMMIVDNKQFAEFVEKSNKELKNISSSLTVILANVQHHNFDNNKFKEYDNNLKRILPKDWKSYKVSYDKELLKVLSNHFQCSKSNILDCIELINKNELITILENYGIDSKQVKRMVK